MSTKTCTHCFHPYPATAEYFPPHKATRDHLNSWCRVCDRARVKEWRKSNPLTKAEYKARTIKRRAEHPGEEQRYRLARYRRYRDELLAYYGGEDGPRCVCCGEYRRDFLSFDHVDGGGAEHRRAVGTGFAWLQHLRQTHPTDIQLLCYGCNEAKRTYRACPHKVPRPRILSAAVQMREEILLHYGHGAPACECCGATGLPFLALDHRDGGGNKHRTEIGRGPVYYRWIIRNGYPDLLRILCTNCNRALGNYGRCPHDME